MQIWMKCQICFWKSQMALLLEGMPSKRRWNHAPDPTRFSKVWLLWPSECKIWWSAAVRWRSMIVSSLQAFWARGHFRCLIDSKWNLFAFAYQAAVRQSWYWARSISKICLYTIKNMGEEGIACRRKRLGAQVSWDGGSYHISLDIGLDHFWDHIPNHQTIKVLSNYISRQSRHGGKAPLLMLKFQIARFASQTS